MPVRRKRATEGSFGGPETIFREKGEFIGRPAAICSAAGAAAVIQWKFLVTTKTKNFATFCGLVIAISVCT